MRLIGLTGDIAAGKSTVSQMLEEKGAVIVDADRIAREVVEPGTPALRAIAERFGPSVIRPDGTLDRAALAAMVFADDVALKDLNAITHPAIAAEVARRVAEHAGSDRVVVFDIALMRDKQQYGVELMVLVTAPEEERVRRMIGERGATEADARARIAAQAYLADRARHADVVIDNSGTRDDLARQVDALWERLTS